MLFSTSSNFRQDVDAALPPPCRAARGAAVGDGAAAVRGQRAGRLLHRQRQIRPRQIRRHARARPTPPSAPPLDIYCRHIAGCSIDNS